MTGADRALRIATVALVLALCFVGLAMPRSILVGGCAWLAFLFPMFAGWGSLAIRATRTENVVDFAMRVVWGVAAFLAVAGIPLALGLCNRTVLLGLAAIGTGGFAWHELTAPELVAWKAARRAYYFVRTHPAIGGAVIVLVGLALVHLVGAVATLDRNPWDDDIAYTPLVKRLLDIGDLVEPFSFRRLGAYGGQTVLQGLGAARGTLASVHLIDRGFAQGLVLLLVVGYARERRAHGLWLALVVLVLLLAPHTFINTASYWTGAAVFLGLYRSVVRDRWLLAGLVAAAACTLRMNYLPVVALFLVIALGFRLRTAARASTWRDAWRTGKHAWIAVTATAVVATVPYAIASLVASHTFLFPAMSGTLNHSIALSPAVMSWTDELAGLAWSSIETAPIVIVPLLFIVMVFVTDDRIARPLLALFIASVVGFVMLVHSFPAAGPFHVWRYAFGFAATLTVVMAIELAGTDDGGEVRLPQLGRWLLLAALVLQLLVTRGGLPKLYAELFADVGEAVAIDRVGDPNATAERAHYATMQAAIPAGARVLVMLDDPAFLDYQRNAIANLDLPGFASPGDQLPTFEGAAAWHAYLRARGFSYVAFVRSDASRYAFRRGFWLARMVTDQEFFSIASAYAIDAIDTLAELATRLPVIHDADGLVVVDLRGDAGVVPAAAPEPARRATFIRALADRERLHDAWTLTTRTDVRFEDGFGTATFVDAKGEVVPGEAGGTTTRGLQRRAHVRVRGDRAMHLVARGKVALDRAFARPRLDVSLDGDLVTSSRVAPDGSFVVDAVIPADHLAGSWHDLYLVFSAIDSPEKNVHDLQVARLDTLEWEPQ